MRGFREIREAQRPGNTSKEVKFSEETMKKYNDLFAEDHQQENRKLRGNEYLAGVMSAEAAQKIANVVAENPEIKESINTSCDALLSQPRVDDLEVPLPKNPFELDPYVVEKVSAYLTRKQQIRKKNKEKEIKR